MSIQSIFNKINVYSIKFQLINVYSINCQLINVYSINFQLINVYIQQKPTKIDWRTCLLKIQNQTNWNPNWSIWKRPTSKGTMKKNNERSEFILSSGK